MNVDQPQLELQLKVWKELAISKQVLMRTVTDALKLDPTCGQDELKLAIDTFLKRIEKSEADLLTARNEARISIAEMERKVAASAQAQAQADAAAADLRAKFENITQEMALERVAFGKEQQKFKDRIAEKEKALKAINTALADTPENVLKKMNVLKKQRQEEADARREVEASFTSLRKEKQVQDQKTNAVSESSTKLVSQYRDLHALSLKLREQLQPLVAEVKDVPAVPDIDDDLLESIENPDAKKSDGKKSDAKKKADGKPKK